ncbi:MAG: hypothetical protein ACP5N7_01050 [Candidatus Pacearchaeota archaeon]
MRIDLKKIRAEILALAMMGKRPREIKTILKLDQTFLNNQLNYLRKSHKNLPRFKAGKPKKIETKIKVNKTSLPKIKLRKNVNAVKKDELNPLQNSFCKMIKSNNGKEFLFIAIPSGEIK